MNTQPTQKTLVLSHMKELGSISPAEALRDYKITRLAARIGDLKKMGYEIVSEMRKHPRTGVAYARYSFAELPIS